MLKELKVGLDYKPELKKYEDKDLPEGFVRVRTEFGAPKHGTELGIFKIEPYAETYYDEKAFIFKKKSEKSSVAGKMGLGNMFVGKIVELGEGVEGFEIGQRVAGYGSLKSTQTVNAGGLLKMPERMTWKEAMCFDPLQFAMGGVRDGHLRLGDKVLVSGMGAIGLMAAQAAKLAGASFVAVSDPIKRRREVALKNGADIAFDPMKDDIGLMLREYTQGIGVDVVIESSGTYPAMEQGLRALSYGGTLAMVGWLKECKHPINLGYEGHFNAQKIVFSRACNDINPDYPRWDFDRICKEAWQMLGDGKFNCELIVDPVVKFEQSDKMYKKYVIDSPEESVKMGVEF